MAKILNGFLGDAINKLGNVVLLRSKNGAIVRSYQPKVFNPKTPGQQSARNNLKLTTQFLSLINTTFIKFLYGISGINKNQFGRAVRDNKNLIDDKGNVNFKKLILGVSNFPAAIIKTVTYNAFTDSLKIESNANTIFNDNDFDFSFIAILGNRISNNDVLFDLDLRHLCTVVHGPFWVCNQIAHGQDVYDNWHFYETRFLNYFEGDLVVYKQPHTEILW
jgi:hypothetical protein